MPMIRKIAIFTAVLLSLLQVSAAPQTPAAPTPIPETASPLRVHFIDVGHGDAILIQTPKGNNILIDAGFYNASYNLINYMKKAGVKRLSLVIATHPHSDHIGGMSQVFRNFDTEMILESGKVHSSRSYEYFMEAIKEKPRIKHVIARDGQIYRVDDVRFKILSPRDPLPDNINDCSVVCRMTYGNLSVLFAGDAEKRAEMGIVQRHWDIKSKVLKVGHHGSSTSTTPNFLAKVSPEVAVISCRERDAGGYPPAAAQRLEEKGIKVFRTDLHGTIVLESDGKSYTIEALGDQKHTDQPTPSEGSRSRS